MIWEVVVKTRGFSVRLSGLSIGFTFERFQVNYLVSLSLVICIMGLMYYISELNDKIHLKNV